MPAALTWGLTKALRIQSFFSSCFISPIFLTWYIYCGDPVQSDNEGHIDLAPSCPCHSICRILHGMVLYIFRAEVRNLLSQLPLQLGYSHVTWALPIRSRGRNVEAILAKVAAHIHILETAAAQDLCNGLVSVLTKTHTAAYHCGSGGER